MNVASNDRSRDMDHSGHDGGGGGLLRGRSGLVLLGFLVIAAFFLVTEHRAHVIPYLSYLPWLLILACPLLHLFMHGGHGGHGGSGDAGGGSPPDHRQDASPH